MTSRCLPLPPRGGFRTAARHPPSTEAVRAAADDYLDALGRGDERRAVEPGTGLVDAGSCPQELLLELVTPAQMCVGELWESGRWSVAQEHAATCVAERVVAAVGARTRTHGEPRPRGALLPGRRVARPHRTHRRRGAALHDWRVTFLGASTPPVHLVSFLHQHGPDVVALSAALPIRLPAARQTVVAAQRTGTPGAGRWRRLPCRRLLRPQPRRRRVGAHGPRRGGAARPPALAGTGCRHGPSTPVPRPSTRACRERRGRLVVAALESLRSGAGCRCSWPTPALDDDLGQAVDFLAAAMYFVDRGLFAGHVGWLARVSASRGAPEAALAGRARRVPCGAARLPVRPACLDAGHEVLATPVHNQVGPLEQGESRDDRAAADRDVPRGPFGVPGPVRRADVRTVPVFDEHVATCSARPGPCLVLDVRGACSSATRSASPR